jgi:hypothetical protein
MKLDIGGNWPVVMAYNFTLVHKPVPDDWAGMYEVKGFNVYRYNTPLHDIIEVIDWLNDNIKHIDNNVWWKGLGNDRIAFRNKEDMYWFIMRFSS